MFGIKKTDLDSTFTPSIPAPFIDKAVLTDVNLDSPSKKEGKNFEVIQFVYEATSGDHAGLQYRHIEWDPNKEGRDEEAVQKKAASIAKRVGHLCSYYVPDSVAKTRDEKKAWVADNIAGETWNEYRKNVYDFFNKVKKEKYSKKEVTIKIVGFITAFGPKKGTPDSGFPNYPPFIADETSAAPLVFDDKERAQNALYLRKISASPQDMESEAEADSAFTFDAPADEPAATSTGDDDPWGE
jgi:hypothetical protein